MAATEPGVVPDGGQARLNLRTFTGPMAHGGQGPGMRVMSSLDRVNRSSPPTGILGGAMLTHPKPASIFNVDTEEP